MKTLKRRRRECKTDYLKRLKLLKSGLPRIVFRKTNRYVISQYVTSNEAQDKIVFGLTSKELLKHGWPKELQGSLKSAPAAYLLGLLTGKKMEKNKLDKSKVVVDFGMLRVLHKSNVYAFLKGLADAGVSIKCSEELFPDEERIKGKHLIEDFSKFFDKIKSSIEKL